VGSHTQAVCLLHPSKFKKCTFGSVFTAKPSHFNRRSTIQIRVKSLFLGNSPYCSSFIAQIPHIHLYAFQFASDMSNSCWIAGFDHVFVDVKIHEQQQRHW
jgi:hypothetical protein